MIQIDFIDISENQETTSLAITAASTALAGQDGDLSIVFCDNSYIQQMNREYRGMDRPTDVLSFPSDEIDPESNRRYFGDIIISYPQAVSQSEEAGNPIQSEISMLVTHGILHLKGYDHTTPDEKKEMWDLQTSILSQLGIHMEKFTGDE
jgi:probable rRNA maturation factor